VAIPPSWRERPRARPSSPPGRGLDTVLADTVLADTVLADTVLADTVLADTVLADTVLADTVLAGLCGCGLSDRPARFGRASTPRSPGGSR